MDFGALYGRMVEIGLQRKAVWSGQDKAGTEVPMVAVAGLGALALDLKLRQGVGITVYHHLNWCFRVSAEYLCHCSKNKSAAHKYKLQDSTKSMYDMIVLKNTTKSTHNETYQ